MEIGIGLGRVGREMLQRLRGGRHWVVAFDPRAEESIELAMPPPVITLALQIGSCRVRTTRSEPSWYRRCAISAAAAV